MKVILKFFLNIPLVNTLKVPIQSLPVYILRHVEGKKLECVLMHLEIFFYFFTQNLVITYFPLRSGTLNVHNIEGERKKEILLSVLTIEIL